MKILITGTSSGVGKELANRLQHFDVIPLSRSILDLSITNDLLDYNIDKVDMLINCAGTGIGGKIDLVNHSDVDVIEILNTNLLAPVILCKKALKLNPNCAIVNITSTNNNRYYAGDLVYSLSKQALATFGSMLRIEYPNVHLLEVRLGLTKTNFNQNRYLKEPERYVDIYQQPHLLISEAVDKIIAVLFDRTIKTIEVSV